MPAHRTPHPHRYDAHGKAGKKALEEGRHWSLPSERLERLSDEVTCPVTQLRFIGEAWEQVGGATVGSPTRCYCVVNHSSIPMSPFLHNLRDAHSLTSNSPPPQVAECRRVLKWTYAYGFYAFDAATAPAEVLAKKEFFEFLQGNAEVGGTFHSSLGGLLGEIDSLLCFSTIYAARHGFLKKSSPCRQQSHSL